MKKITIALIGLLITLVISISQLYSQSTDSLAAVARMFAQQLDAALAEPFQGIATSAGVEPGLFPLRSTGVSTESIRTSANDFLSSLNTAQRRRIEFPIDDSEWRNWSNVDLAIFPRQGVSLEEMSTAQKAAAWRLLTESLSAEGVEQSQNIMRTDHRLRELNDDVERYGEEKYYFTVMGTPSATEPWGWQLDGHHLIINYFVLGDQVVMTPAFWGGEPIHSAAGKYQGNIVLQEEQDRGLAFMQTLDANQQVTATLNPEKTGDDQQAAANQDNLTLDYQGIQGSDLQSSQKLELLGLINTYIGNLRGPHAEITMAEIGQHINDTWFAWVGSTDNDSVFYYRIHSPVILIEFDHQNPIGTTQKNSPGMPTRDHIHTVVRTPNGNDYGKDLLAQHLSNHPH